MPKLIKLNKKELKELYWKEEQTSIQIAKTLNCSAATIERALKRFDLLKIDNNIPKKRFKKKPISEEQKELLRQNNPNSKEIIVYRKDYKKYKIFPSIAATLKELNLRRGNVCRCLKTGIKATTNGYRFKIKKYKGELLVERRENLDFTREADQVTNGLITGLPKYPRKERIKHFNHKLRKVWLDLNYYKRKKDEKN